VRDGAIWRFAGVPFTGRLVETTRDGTRVERALREGRPHGEERSWYAGGALRSIRMYEQGQKTGVHRGWWPDGRPQFERRFVAGISEGLSRTWHPNGQLFEEHRYVAGQESGLQQLWFESGAPRASYEIRNGRRYGSIGSKACASKPHEGNA
jgi:antitoxin component YwqK of YwqJK toxin-antitoxin module